jgi:hypothetical protein
MTSATVAFSLTRANDQTLVRGMEADFEERERERDREEERERKREREREREREPTLSPWLVTKFVPLTKCIIYSLLISVTLLQKWGS